MKACLSNQLLMLSPAEFDHISTSYLLKITKEIRSLWGYNINWLLWCKQTKLTFDIFRPNFNDQTGEHGSVPSPDLWRTCDRWDGSGGHLHRLARRREREHCLLLHDRHCPLTRKSQGELKIYHECYGPWSWKIILAFKKTTFALNS